MSESARGRAGLKVEEDGGLLQIRHNRSSTPLGPTSALSMAQFEEIDGTRSAQGVSPIMLVISSRLPPPFPLHAEVLASLINRSGRLVAV